MSGSIYIVSNDLDNASSIAMQGSSNETYLHDERISRLATGSTAWSSDNSQTITIDMGSSTSMSFAALLNHNFNSSFGDVQVRKSNDNFSVDDNLVSTFTYRDRDMYVTFSSQSERYWQIRINGDNSSDTPAIGQLVIGVQIQLTKQFNWGAKVEELWNNIQHETPGGKIWSYNQQATQRYTWRVQYDDISASDLDEIRTLIEATKGGHLPFTWVPDPDNSDSDEAARVYYMRAQNVFSWTDNFNKMVPSLVLREEARELA